MRASERLLYVVPAESSWVCSEELMHAHAMAGFFRQLMELEDERVEELMQRWGLYYRQSPESRWRKGMVKGGDLNSYRPPPASPHECGQPYPVSEEENANSHGCLPPPFCRSSESFWFHPMHTTYVLAEQPSR